MAGGRLYTEAELKLIVGLRAAGVDWPDIAERVARPVSGVRAMAHYYWTGRWKGASQRIRERNERAIRLYETTDLTVPEIARALEVSVSALNAAFRNHGFDAEARTEIRRSG